MHDPICRRIMSLGSGKAVEIFLYSPVKIENLEYHCRFIVKWPEKVIDRSIPGVDEFQSLVLALKTIGAELYNSTYALENMIENRFQEPFYGFLLPDCLME